ncbi:MAG: SRPBCC family protein [Alphaproteobacteria bacterium]|nr:SRPBCC family protein [Alphaproteobacteria bacterium]
MTRSTVIDAPIERVWEVLRDFNSHDRWHPAVARSHIEGGEPPDQVGCVRNFHLADGNHIREQLIALSDTDRISTYCILDATVPLQRYVATLQLKPVTDGDRTFWHWQSTFDTPPGREAELADMVGRAVYEAGFEALRRYLRSGGERRSRPTSVGAARGGDMTGQAVVLKAFGGADQLSFENVTVPPPGHREVRIRQSAAGVNYIDVYIAEGEYRMVEPPAAIGMEAAGTVIDVGSDVHDLLPGDSVAYAYGVPGAFATLRTLPSDQVVRVPAGIEAETAAAVLFKGLTAEYLVHRVHTVRAGETILVHAAAGGVGTFLCQWAKHLGARVIGTVSSEEKARIARENGCDLPIVSTDYRFAEAIKAATGGRGVDVVYDGLGRLAERENYDALAPTGHWVAYGHASGALPPLDPALQSAKSLRVSRPVLFHYTDDPARLRAMATNVFAMLERGVLKVTLRHRYPLSAAAFALQALQSRQTIGPLVLLA